jgi:diaminopimelate epimerase
MAGVVEIGGAEDMASGTGEAAAAVMTTTLATALRRLAVAQKRKIQSLTSLIPG